MALYSNPRPPFRPLRAYAFDPSRGRHLANHMTLRVPFEDLQLGPVGEYVAVIDYDANNRCYYEPVDLDAPDVLIRGGLDPSESDPRFHQQMVYAVVSETIRRFEFALGRKIKWRRPTGARRADRYRRLLKIFPHGIQEANAYYDPKMRALIFGYFQADQGDAGSSLPGQTVFTCLSHDIIVHETTHALIDGLRENFMAATHVDTPAFHEAFADIVALFQHFSFDETLLDAIQRTGGYLYRGQLVSEASAGEPAIAAERAQPNPLVELARQFGEALGTRQALRSAIGTAPDPKQMATLSEPHNRGAILVAAIFDAFFSVYIRRTRHLMRLVRNNSGGSAPPDLHPDLAKLLAAAASKTAVHFSNICIRALDYCPPVDIRFGEFLRALLTADTDLVPSDPAGYRPALIEAFRTRGIVPDGVASYSEEALRWQPPERGPTGRSISRCAGLQFDIFGDQSDRGRQANAILLSTFGRENATRLRLAKGRPVQAFSFHPIHRVGPDGRIVYNYVAELLQRRQARVDPRDPASPRFTFFGGVTLIIERDGTVRYAICKRLDNEHRLEEQRAYCEQVGLDSVMAPYRPEGAFTPTTPCAIHRGY